MTLSPTGLLKHLLEETRGLAAAEPLLQNHGDMLASMTRQEPVVEPPHALPVCERLESLRSKGVPATDSVCRAILDHHGYLCWRQSYDSQAMPPGWDKGYGWFNIISPEGPFRADSVRLSVGVWMEGLKYPPHRHPPEEVYLVLAGEADFWQEGGKTRRCRAGDSFHNRPGQAHSLSMRKSPLMAAAFWFGDQLMAPSTFA